MTTKESFVSYLISDLTALMLTVEGSVICAGQLDDSSMFVLYFSNVEFSKKRLMQHAYGNLANAVQCSI
jgi:hypothetical protein